MKISESSSCTPRSSPRSKRKRAEAIAGTELPVLKIDGKRKHTSAEAETSQANHEDDKVLPTKSRKRVKVEATIATENSLPLEKKADTKGVKQSNKIRKAKREIQSQSPQPESERDLTKRKLGEQGQQELDIDGQTPQRSKLKASAKVTEIEVQEDGASPKKIKRKRVEIDEGHSVDGGLTPGKAKRKTKVKAEVKEDDELDENGEPAKKTKRKRKTKEEKEVEAMPLAARTNGLRMFIGAHVSCAKGVHNSVTNCVHIGGNAFAMFLKSQRKWENPPLQDDHRDLFISSCGDHKYDASSHVLPHGSYLVNLAQEEPEKASQAYNAFLDDLHRCEALGIKLYNFHPGSTGSHPRPSAIARIAKALNRAHAATETVTPVLETMAGGGNVVGSTFEDLRDIIALIDDKNRIGVCIDTCHVFAAGYDLRAPTTFKQTLDKFDKIVGMKYLRALHLNDSKAPFNSHRDLHQNIGLGFLGLRAFHNVMNETRFEGLPMVLETPIDHKDEETGKDVEDKNVWAREIKMLEGLIGTDPESDDFKALEKELADKGAEERKKLQEQYEKKVEKDRKAAEKGQTKLSFGKKKKKESDVED